MTIKGLGGRMSQCDGWRTHYSKISGVPQGCIIAAVIDVMRGESSLYFIRPAISR